MEEELDVYTYLNEGLTLYRSGYPFEAHEIWEEAWRGEVGRNRLTLQALIQIAAGVYKHKSGVPAGACKLLAKAGSKLEEIQSGCSAWLGVDLVALSEEVKRALSEADAIALGRGSDLRAPRLPEVCGPDGVLYLHGFASSPQSKKAQSLTPPLEKRGLFVSIPDQNEGDFGRLTLSRSLALARRSVRDRTILLGSSLGGYLATLLAARDDRVKAMVLMAPAFDFAERLKARYGDAAIEVWRSQGQVEVEHHATGAPEPLRYGFFEDAQKHAPYPKIRVPTVIIHGKNDDSVAIEVSREAQRRAPQWVELIEVEDDHSLLASTEIIREQIERTLERFRIGPDPEPAPLDAALKRIQSLETREA